MPKHIQRVSLDHIGIIYLCLSGRYAFSKLQAVSGDFTVSGPQWDHRLKAEERCRDA